MIGALATKPFAPAAAVPAPMSRARRIPIGGCLAVGLVGAYLARASLLTYVGTQWTINLVAQISVVALLAACAYLAAGGLARLNGAGVFMICAGAASFLHCETVDYARTRWMGWALMLVAVGPVLRTDAARGFRRAAADAMAKVIVAATLASAAWWIAGLPNLGRGDFTGVLWHSMTLGPVAALAGVLSLARATTGGAWAWYGVYAVAANVAVLAASRSALAGLVLGTMVIAAIKLKRRPLLSAAALGLGMLLAAAPDAAVELAGRVVPEGLASGLTRKSWDHTREAHWDARLEEFLYSPWTGVGFACGWEDTAGFNDETGAIETGSSYLSILSMTGGVGAGAFLLLVARGARGLVWRWRDLGERQRLESLGLGAFWAVHLGAEGYIYGVGSLMGLAFWLWLGRLFDQVEMAPRRAAG